MSAKDLTPSEIKKLAKKIISTNPIYMPDEPTVVGSVKNLFEELEEVENEESSATEPKGSKGS